MTAHAQFDTITPQEAIAQGAPVRLYLDTRAYEPVATIRGRQPGHAWLSAEARRLREGGRIAFLVRSGARLTVMVNKPEGLRQACASPDCIMEVYAGELCKSCYHGSLEEAKCR